MSTPTSTVRTLPPLDLAVKLFDHYESIAEVKHYYGLLAIYALARVAEKRPALFGRVRQILERFPDEIEHPKYNFPSYRIGGIPRAFMLFRGQMTDDRTRALVREYADEMMTAARDPDGIMSNPWAPADNKVWIDVAMAVTPYLLFAGLTFNEPKYIDEAAKQTVLMYDLFLNPANGLLHQAKNFTNPHRLITEDHWGRGNGWGYIALTELVQYLPRSHPRWTAVKQRFVALSEALLPHQSGRGLWRQEVPMPEAWEESSGTGLFLYGFGVGMRLGLLDTDRFGPAFRRGIAAIREHCINDDFSTELCCPGCLAPGTGPNRGTAMAYVTDKQPVRDDGHSFAPLMLALAEAT
jgi:unsaturated rhamnogalacturonyl hydrolase